MSRGKVSVKRREFLKYAGLVVGLATTGPLAAACATPAPTPTTAPTTAPAATPTTAAKPTAAPTTAPAASPTAAASAATPTTAAKPTAAPAASPTVAAKPTTSSQPATLRFTYWDEPEKPGIDRQIQLFQDKNPNVKVTGELTPWDEYWTKLQTSLAGGVAPDVWWQEMARIPAWAATNTMLDIKPMIAADKELSDASAATWDLLQKGFDYENKRYAIPRDYDTVAIVYNEDLIKAAGLQSPAEIDETWTWENVQQYAEKLTKKEGSRTTQFGFYFTSTSYHTGFSQWVWGNGGEFFSADGKATIDRPENIGAFQYLVNNKAYSPTGEALEAQSAGDLFRSGRLAMMQVGSWDLRTYAEITRFKWNAAQVPLGVPKIRRSTMHSLGNAISANTKNADPAVLFVRHLASKECEEILGRNGTVIPARKDVADTFFAATLPPPNRKAFLKAADYGHLYINLEPFKFKTDLEELIKPLRDVVPLIFQGKMQPAEALKQAQAAIAPKAK